MRWIIPAGRPKAGRLLSAAQQRRYEKRGITRSAYESGVSVKAARGHAQTPEHGLGQALRNPARYKSYIQRKSKPDTGTRAPSPEAEARLINDTKDQAYKSMQRLHEYLYYKDETVQANLYGGITAESGEVPGMSHAEALWTAQADIEEIRSYASPQYKGNPWWYH
jgi:hypothetical protein